MRLLDVRTGAVARVVVLANGWRTHEYEVENLGGNLQCWIAAETDKKVSVQWDFTAEHKYYQVDLFVDGVFQDTCSGESSYLPGLPEIVHDLLDGGVSIGLEDQMYRHQMFFKERAPLVGNKIGGGVRSAIGTIELRIYHEIENKLVSPPPCAQLARSEDILEDVFNRVTADAKDPTYCVLFKNQTRITHGTAEKKENEVFKYRPGISPWATFKFFYRSKALSSMGIILLPSPEDFSVRFRSRATSPPKALSSPITFKSSYASKQDTSTRIPFVSRQDSASGTPVNMIVGNFVDSSRDPRLHPKKKLEEELLANAGKKKQSQLMISEHRQQLPEEERMQDIEGNDEHGHRYQDQNLAQEAQVAIEFPENRLLQTKGNGNVPEVEDEEDTDAVESRNEEYDSEENDQHGHRYQDQNLAQEAQVVIEVPDNRLLQTKGSGNVPEVEEEEDTDAAESRNEEYDSEGNEGDNEDDMVQDKGLKVATKERLAEERKQLAPTTKTVDLPSYRPLQTAFQVRNTAPINTLGKPSVVDHSRSHWIPINVKPAIPESQDIQSLSIRSMLMRPSEAQNLSEGSNSTLQNPTSLNVSSTTETNRDPESSNTPQPEPPASRQDNASTGSPSTFKRKRSNSSPSEEDFSQETPETKQQRYSISSLKLELVKNSLARQEKIRKLEAVLRKRNQEITDEIDRIDKELKVLEAVIEETDRKKAAEDDLP